jgi:ketosteroid isomerase-like protein
MTPEDTVRRFLLDVRSGRHPDRAGDHLAATVRAHQGPPGREHAVVTRTPAQYAEHVRDMQRALGPWTFRVLGVAAHGDVVEATWRQDGRIREGAGRGRTVVEHGRAAYRVRDGRIVEYWIDVTHR